MLHHKSEMDNRPYNPETEPSPFSNLKAIFTNKEGLVDRSGIHKNKYEGIILGGGIGDALGMPTEGLTREQIQELFGPCGIQCYMSPPDGTRFYGRLRPGQYTDDTQLMLATINGILSPDVSGEGSLQKQVRALLAVKDSLRGAGRATWTAINRLGQGISPKKSGIEDAIGTGAMTRVVPYLLMEMSDISWEIMVEDVTRMTHNNETSVKAVFMYGRMLNQLISGYQDGGEGYINLDTMEGRVAYLNHQAKLHPKETDGIKRVKTNIAALAKDGLVMSEDEFALHFGTTGAVWDVLPAALYAFLKSPQKFEESVLRAINLGGDTDTIGCVTGQLSGAYNGIHFIPEYLISGLEEHQEIRNLADRLFEQAE